MTPEDRDLLRRVAERVARRWEEQLEQRRRMYSTADTPYRTLDQIITEEIQRA